ncbi:hypothetical protein B0H19DRAFT_1253011 [Mycena capillaripes]|nr:hypothetical protein B0H19DRAFT_1253011 [Mycena capillaripes]
MLSLLLSLSDVLPAATDESMNFECSETSESVAPPALLVDPLPSSPTANIWSTLTPIPPDPSSTHPCPCSNCLTTGGSWRYWATSKDGWRLCFFCADYEKERGETPTYEAGQARIPSPRPTHIANPHPTIPEPCPAKTGVPDIRILRQLPE